MNNILGTVYHPEISNDLTHHALFINMINHYKNNNNIVKSTYKS